jgi:chitodextrinase
VASFAARPHRTAAAVARKPPPLPLRLRLGIIGLVVLLLAGIGAAVLRFVGGGVLAMFDQQAGWRGGYTGQFLVKNETKNDMPSWKMEFDLPAGSKIVRHWGATKAVTGGHYVFTRDGAHLKPHSATRFQFIVEGSGKPENCRMNDAPCDQGNDTAAPTVPRGLRVTGATVSTIRLAWQPATDDTAVSSYRVYMDGKLAASTSATATTISRLPRGKRHAFALSAIDMKGNESPRSAAVAGTTLARKDAQRPSAPTGLRVGKVTTLSVTISWKPAADNVGVVGYNVYLGSDVVATSAQPRATITGLPAGAVQAIRVAAVDAAENESSPSAPLTVRTAEITAARASGPSKATGARAGGVDTAGTLRAAPAAHEPGRWGPVALPLQAALQAQADQADQLSFLANQVTAQAQVAQQFQQVAAQARQQVLAAQQQAAQVAQQLEQAAQQAQFQIEQAKLQAAGVEQQVDLVVEQARQITDAARKAQQDAQDATAQAQDASRDAGSDVNAQQQAQQLIQRAVQAQQFAQQLGQQAAQAQASVQQAQQQAQQAAFQVQQAEQQADQVTQQAGQARQQARQQVEFAERQAAQAEKQAKQAQQALDKALKALSDAQSGKSVPEAPSGSGSGNTASAAPRLRVVAVTDSSVTLRWTPPAAGAGVGGYEILRDGAVVQRLPGSATTTVVAGLDAESEFTFTVVGRGRDGNRSKPSNPVRAVTLAAGLDDSATPANLHAACVTDHSVSLDWDAPADVSRVAGYDVYAGGQRVASTRGTSTTIRGLDPQQRIQFVVKSRDSSGLNSPPSRVAAVTTLREGERSRQPSIQQGQQRQQEQPLPKREQVPGDSPDRGYNY